MIDRRRAIFVGKAAAILSVIPVLIYAYTTGPDPRNTGAPGDTTCSQTGCHLGTVNPAEAKIDLTFPGDLTYTPGVKQTLTVTVATASSAKVYGFQASVRSAGTDGYKTTQAGTFSFTDKTLQVLCGDEGQLRGSAGCKATQPLEFIEHGGGGSVATSKNSWTFDWTPPATDVGDIKIYVAGNAGNGDGKSDNKDLISTNVYTLKAASGGPSNKPAISAGGVVTVGNFGGAPAMGPGSWIEIYGSNLSAATRPWGGGDFAGNSAPTTLDGVKVTIANVPGFISYISPGQVNVQVPSSVGPGQQDIVVTNANGTSEAYSAKVNVTQPGLLAPSSFIVGGKQYVAALFADNSFVLPPGAIAGLGTKQAKPGETIIVYGVGFGATSPNIVAGQIVTVSNQVASPVTVTIGGSAATVSYGGLAPNFVGLYQFNVVVPDIADNDQAPVVFSLGGTPVAQTLVTAVKK